MCLKGYATMSELLLGLTENFVLYNTERTHQSLGKDTPDQVYRTASLKDFFKVTFQMLLSQGHEMSRSGWEG